MNVLDNFAMSFAIHMSTFSVCKRTMPERILLVDGNQMGLRARKVVLEELGCEVTAVGCSIAAFEAFCTQAFDLIITDYKMPKLDGIELIARVRERKPNIPIILISGFTEALGLNETNTGANSVIQKNSHEVVALTRAVTRLLALRPPKKPVRLQSTIVNRPLQARRSTV